MKIIGIYKQGIFSAWIILLLFSCELDEIPDEITFEKTFGGTANDAGYSVQQTQDGGYIITGYTGNTMEEESDVYLIKTDANGEIVNTDGTIVFEKKFGGAGKFRGYSVQQTQDGSYIITGIKDNTGEGDEDDVYIVKTVPNGNTEDESYFRGYDNLRSVQQTHDGGFIITGSSIEGNVYLIKTDANGNREFEKTFGGANSDVGLSVHQTQDRGYIITGYTYSKGAGESDVYLIKTDANGEINNTNGNIGFEKTFGGPFSDIGNSVQQTQDGGYIITGYTATVTNTIQGFDVYLIKTDANGEIVNTSGNIVFEKTFGETIRDVGNSVKQTEDGGYIITGYTESKGEGGLDVYLIKTNTDGDIVFEKTFGESFDDTGYSVQQTMDRGYIITGYTKTTAAAGNDVYLIKTNANGDVEQ